jgi:hypothetical protein
LDIGVACENAKSCHWSDAGVPRKVAMAMSGHKTDSVYRRYHIVKKEQLIEAGKKLLAHHQTQHHDAPGGHSVDIRHPEASLQASVIP